MTHCGKPRSSIAAESWDKTNGWKETHNNCRSKLLSTFLHHFWAPLDHFWSRKKGRKMRGQTWFAMTITKLHKIFVLHTFTFHRFAACKREREVQKGFKKQSIKVYSKLVFWWWKKFCVSAQKKKMRNCITVVALKSFRRTSWNWEAIVWSFFGVCIK